VAGWNASRRSDAGPHRTSRTSGVSRLGETEGLSCRRMRILPYLEYLLPDSLRSLALPLLERFSLRAWHSHGQPPPPRTVKAQLIRSFGDHRRRTFVETGTFHGDMLWLQRDDFDKLYSIEVSPRLGARAQRRFIGHPHVEILVGDSATLLGKVLHDCATPSVFWLDGHYSGPMTGRGSTATPIEEELAILLNTDRDEDVILIDDARLFGSDPDYPTLDKVSNYVRSRRSSWDVRVHVDVIVCADSGFIDEIKEQWPA
jgi:hypothetical protein